LRRAALAAAAVLALLPAGCGGNDQKTTGSGGGRTATARSQTETSRDADTTTTPARTETTKAKPGKPRGENQQGGAGDEVPAHSQVLLTGKGGKVSPRAVRVAPFIAVQVVLRSADGASYTLKIAGKSLKAGGSLSSDSTMLSGLRAGRSYTGTTGDGSRVTISANAQPGP
jgi:hypothetical protein